MRPGSAERGRPDGTAFAKLGLFTAGPKDTPPGAFTDSAPPAAGARFAEAPGPHSRLWQ
jgi:hypothetical protein